MLIIPALGRLRQEDHKYRTNPGYMERPGLEQTNKQQ
jgi:hypothetical protein